MKTYDIDHNSFSRIVILLIPIFEKSTRTSDNITAVMLSGDFSSAPTVDDFEKILNFLDDTSLIDFLSIRFDEEEVSKSSLHQVYAECDNEDSWSLNFSKPRFKSKIDNELEYLFFLSARDLQSFLKSIDPFSRSHRIFSNERFVILTPNIDEPFIGNKIIIDSPLREQIDFSESFKTLPNVGTVEANTKFSPSQNSIIDLKKFASERFSGDLAKTIRANFVLSLVASLAADLTGRPIARMHGISTIEAPLSNGKESVSDDKLSNLVKSVEWVYEGVFSTRYRLFIDRIILDFETGDTMLTALLKNSRVALDQAIEQYGFVIDQRRDEYFKEVQRLLTEVKKQTDQYLDKLRGLLTGLSRDVLASIFLFGISFMTRAIRSRETETNELTFNYLFAAIGGYLLISWLFQSILLVSDAELSRKDLKTWFRNTRFYLTPGGQKRLLDDVLKKRRRLFWVLYAVLTFLYLGLAFLAIAKRNYGFQLG